MSRIAVSAGHNPGAPGATYKDFVEHEEALLWQRLILKHLEGRGIFVPTGSLTSKTTFINRTDAVLAVEIHFNASPTFSGRGCEALYYPGSAKGKAVAEAVLRPLAPLFPPNRGAKEGWYQLDPAKGPLGFLKNTRCTAVIIEPEFIYQAADIRAKRDEACRLLAKELLWSTSFLLTS